MKATKPSPSVVDGKKEDRPKLMCLKVLLSVEGVMASRACTNHITSVDAGHHGVSLSEQ